MGFICSINCIERPELKAQLVQGASEERSSGAKVLEKWELKGTYSPGSGQEIQHIIDALPFHVLLVDSDHNIVAANAAATRDLGLSLEQLIKGYCPLVVHGCDTPIAECPLTEAFEKGTAVEREVFDPRDARWMKLAVYPTRLATGEGMPIFLHFAQDITQSKNTAGELSRSLEHHSALCNLLQNLQDCQNSTKILEVLIDLDVELLLQQAVQPGQLAAEDPSGLHCVEDVGEGETVVAAQANDIVFRGVKDLFEGRVGEDRA